MHQLPKLFPQRITGLYHETGDCSHTVYRAIEYNNHMSVLHTHDGTPNAPLEAASDVFARRFLEASSDCNNFRLDTPNGKAMSSITLESVKSRFSYQ